MNKYAKVGRVSFAGTAIVLLKSTNKLEDFNYGQTIDVYSDPLRYPYYIGIDQSDPSVEGLFREDEILFSKQQFSYNHCKSIVNNK